MHCSTLFSAINKQDVNSQITAERERERYRERERDTERYREKERDTGEKTHV